MERKKQIAGIAFMVILLAITLCTLLRGETMASLGAILRGVKPFWLLAGLGCIALFIGFEALCTRITLKTLGHEAPCRRCYGYSITGFYFSSVTPSATGGQPAQVYYMCRDGIPAAHGTLDMLLVTICYQLSTLIYALVALLAAPFLLPQLGRALGGLLIFGGCATLLLTGTIVLFMFSPTLAQKLCFGIISLATRLRLVRDRQALEEKLVRQLEEYRRGAQLLRGKPTLLPRLLTCSIFQMTALYLVPYTVYRAFGLSGVPALTLVATQAILTLAVGCLPIPGAVGATEVAFVTVFAGVFGPELVAPAMLLSRGLSFYLPLAITGVVTVLIHLKKSCIGQKPSPVEIG